MGKPFGGKSKVQTFAGQSTQGLIFEPFFELLLGVPLKSTEKSFSWASYSLPVEFMAFRFRDGAKLCVSTRPSLQSSISDFRHFLGLDHVGMGQNLTTRKPQVLVLGSIYQGSILGSHF